MKNIVLIGMPGCGKSTVGIILAKALQMNFVDTDLIIQQFTGERLQDTINSKGLDYFLRIENKILKELNLKNTVIATGGSAVYSKDAMENLKENGVIIFINTPLYKLKKRVKNMKVRGIACDKNMSYDDLYKERIPLYEKYCDITILNPDDILENAVFEIINKLNIKE